MSTRVEASTSNAGQLFSTTYFRIPDFQRDYSWTVKDEVNDFWRDLSDAIESTPYFLGLLITTDEDDVKTVVDGQQRILTLTLLANAIRLAALDRNRRLVADSMRDTFLFGLNYDDEKWSPRVSVAADRDKKALETLLGGIEHVRAEQNELLLDAQKFLREALEQDLIEHSDAPSRLGQWARLVSNGLTFAMFEHPDRNSAYKVYEVVNTRGKDLTPAELIKSYLIGSVPESDQADVVRRWQSLEDPFTELKAANQFTQFVRHVVTLRHGYVIPRDLYQAITNWYQGPAGTLELLTELEGEVELYTQLVEPDIDTDLDDATVRAFKILETLGLRTVRPIFLAAAHAPDPAPVFESLLRVVVPRIVTGPFGTGSVERQFADAARDLFKANDWQSIDERLSDLKPARSDFESRILTRSLGKGVITVLRSSVLQHTALPELNGFLHQVRAKNAEAWPDFDATDFRVLGGTIGNYFFSDSDRRPRGTNTRSAVTSRLLPTAISAEWDEVRATSEWSASLVQKLNQLLAEEAGHVWYGA